MKFKAGEMVLYKNAIEATVIRYSASANRVYVQLPWGKSYVSEDSLSSEMITKDGIEVKIGQVWRDCDKRTCYGKRTVKVVGLNPISEKVRVIASNSSKLTYISLRRMYKHATGYELVTP